ncbi:MAG TPA: AAA family ATPase [Vicinamibacterales bacterium]|nr:AAA family ATPase [Vicinamibacterales bacterium]
MSQWKGYGPDNVLSSEAGVYETGPQSAANAGSLTYEPYYGLKTKPFSLSTDPRAFYNSPIHATVLEDLLGAIRRREGLIVLTGEMGTGKTTLCRAALYQLDRKTFTTFVPDPFLSREDLLRMLLVDFGEVSVDDLRRGRLSGASRPDLSYQLYEFLTSLESVDAFAVLVIDEAQHLAAPLLEEIRALSELEAGRRLLQIVLVGQPELQTRLKHFQMRQIDQRVTVRCELQALTKEDVAGYVAHRLATAGGVRERIAFAPAAIEMIHGASNGIPRLVNVICDRALAHGYVERLSVIGPALVAGAIDELQLMPPREPAWAQPVTIESSTVQPVAVQPAAIQPAAVQPPTAQAVTTQPVTPEPTASPAQTPRERRGLFEKKPVEPATAHVFDLAALLDLTPIAPRQEWERAADHDREGASAVPAWKSRMERDTRHGSRFASLKTVGLAVIGMALMLIAGGIAVTAQRMRPQVAAPAASQAASQAVQAPASIAPSTPTPAQPAARPAQAQVPAAPSAHSQSVPTAAAAMAAPGSQDTWVVQAAAFSSPERSLAMVQRLTQSGFPAFEVTADLGSRGVLYFVRVGPFKTAMEADDARGLVVRQIPDLEGAFVRNVTTK